MEIMQNAIPVSGPYVSDQQISTQHVARLVVSWILMIPLIFFAVEGSVRFDSYSRNNDIEASYTSLIPSQTHGLTRVSLALVSAICALLFCTKLRGIAAIARDNLAFVALAVLALLSTVWSQFPGDSLTLAIYVTLNLCFAFYLAARFTPVRQMQLFVTLGWIVIVPSILVALLFPQYGLVHNDTAFGAWIGIFPEKNWCSIMVAFLLSAAFYMRPASSFASFARIAYVVLSVFLIGMSQARTGWIMAAFLVLYVSATKYLKQYKAKDGFLIAVFVGVVAVLAIAVGANYYSSIVLLLGKDPTLTGRTTIWSLSVGAALKRPLLGYGYRAFWHGLQGESANLSLAKGWIIPAAHEGVLDLWLSLGAVGVGAVAYSMFWAIKNAVTCFRGGSSPAAEWYLCIIFLTLVSNTASLTLMVPNCLAWILYVLACVGLSQEAKRSRLGMVHA